MIFDFDNEHRNWQFVMILNCQREKNDMRNEFDFKFVEFMKMFDVKQSYDDNLKCFANIFDEFFVNENVFLNFRIE